MAVATGHGTTLAFGTSSFTAAYTEIGGFTQERPALDTSDLSTTGHRTMIPGDLATPGSFDITGFYDTTDGLPNASGTNMMTTAAETVTQTIPDSAGGSDATFVGSAFLTSMTSPTLATDTLMTFGATVQWADDPTETVEA